MDFSSKIFKFRSQCQSRWRLWIFLFLILMLFSYCFSYFKFGLPAVGPDPKSILVNEAKEKNGTPAASITDYSFRSIADYFLQLINNVKPSEKFQYPSGSTLPLIFLIGIIAVFTWISEDLACIGAGLMVSGGTLAFLPAVIGSFCGILFADMAIYLAGKFLGQKAFQIRPFKWFVSREDISKSSKWFKNRGAQILVASRFIPGSRFPTYFAAGILGYGMGTFIIYFCGPLLLWTPAMVGLSAFLGEQMFNYFQIFQKFALWAGLAVLAVLWIASKFLFPFFRFRGRKLPPAED